MNAEKAVITSIRREKYLLDFEGEVTAEVQRGILNMHSTLDRTLHLLSVDLYNEETHFVLELIQNADDNAYDEDIIPTLHFDLTARRLRVTNNEQGFAEPHVRALCSVGESSKTSKQGFIGEKGIGFKSVFTVSDAPEVHSNGYHFRFDRQHGSLLGYVAPDWIEEATEAAGAGTTIVLPAKSAHEFDESVLSGLSARLLLFLNKIRHLELTAASGRRRWLRRDEGVFTTLMSVTEAPPGGREEERAKFVRITLALSMADVREAKRPGVEETRIVIALPVTPDGRALPTENCDAYAFLPIRPFGFSFYVQADFLLSASREDIHRNAAWNRRLRDGIAEAFVSSLDTVRTERALALTYLQFLPKPGALEEAFFGPVATQLEERLREARCIICEDGEWRKPPEVLVASREFRALVTDSEVRELFGLHYPDQEIDVSVETLKRLGCRALDFDMIVALFGQHGDWLRSKSHKWVARLFAYIATREPTEKVVKQLRACPCVPTNGGDFATPDRMSVFRPLHATVRYGFEQELTLVNSDIVERAEELTPLARKLFERLGVCAAVPFDVVQSHILPRHRSEEWKSSENRALIGHLRYIKDHWGDITSGAAAHGLSENTLIEALRTGLRLGTKNRVKDGLWYFGQAPTLYLSSGYRPAFCIETLLGDDIGKNLLVADYLPSTAKRAKGAGADKEVREWREFLVRLGVRQAPKVVRNADGNYQCSPELGALLGSQKAAVRRATLECLDRHWAAYSEFLSYSFKSGRKSITLATKFASDLTSVLAPTKKRIAVPIREAYLPMPELKEIFGDAAAYVDADLRSSGFIAATGVTASANVSACLKRLRQLKREGGDTTSVLHAIYRRLERLWDGGRAEIEAALSVEALIRVRGDHPRWALPREVVWSSSRSPFLDGLYPPLERQYTDFSAFFVTKLGVPRELPVSKMVEALPQLAQLGDGKTRLDEALRIYRRASLELNPRFGQPPKEPEWLTSFRRGASFLTTDGRVTANSHNLYVNDVPSIGGLFADAPELLWLAVAPEQLPPVKRLLEAASVRFLSSSITVEAVATAGGAVATGLTATVRALMPSVARLVYHASQDRFDAACAEGLFEEMQRMNVVEVEDLSLRVRLAEVERTTQGDIARDEGGLLIRRGTKSLVDRIALELCRYLRIPDAMSDSISRLMLTANDAGEVEDYLRVKGVSELPAEEAARLVSIVQGTLQLESENSPGADAPVSLPEGGVTAAEPQNGQLTSVATAKLGTSELPDTAEPRATIQGQRESTEPSAAPVDAAAAMPAPASAGVCSGGSLSSRGHGEPAGDTLPQGETASGAKSEFGATSGEALSSTSSTGSEQRDPTASEILPLTDASDAPRPAGAGGGSRDGSAAAQSASNVGRRRPFDRQSRTRGGRLLSYADAPGDVEEQSDVTGATERDATAKAAVAFFLDTQASRWRSLTEMPHNNPGFDILAEANDGGTEFIEVKGQTRAWTEEGVALTPRELMKAAEMRERYWLCVVEFARDEARRKLYLVRDPFGLTGQFRYDRGWKSQALVQASRPTVPAQGLAVRVEGEGAGTIFEVKPKGQFFRVGIRWANGQTVFRIFNPTTMTLSE